MLKISNLQAKLIEEDKQILNGVELEIGPGEVHVLQGRNGSGKSSLAQVISGHPKFEVTGGKLDYDLNHISPELKEIAKVEGDKVNLAELEAHQRSLLGIFHANQYPLEIPGVNLSSFLRLTYNARRSQKLPPIKFNKLLKERAAVINYPEKLLDRNLNEGFSGGEKKKTEVLQLAILEPSLAILDETDSGLDSQAVYEVFEGINQLRKEVLPKLSLLIITHYQTPIELIKPDKIYQMDAGKILS